MITASVMKELILRQIHFKAWFLCNHEISILHEMTPYRTIWRRLLSHTTCLFQVSFVCDFNWAPFHSFFLRKFFAAFDEVTLWDWWYWFQYLHKFSCHISVGFLSRLIGKGKIAGKLERQKNIGEYQWNYQSINFCTLACA